MKRPGIVTGFAYLNLMSVLSAVWLFDARAHIGVDVLHPESLLPARMQWMMVNVGIATTTLTTVGFFRGWNWARWLALVLCSLGYVANVPVRDLHALPGYLFLLVGSILAFTLLFFFPSSQTYFSSRAARRGSFSVRAAISTVFLLLSAFTAHSIVMGAYRKTLPVEIAWIGLGVFLLPTLLLSMLVRWKLDASVREISAVLLGIAVYFVYMLLSNFIHIYFVYPPAALPYFGWLNSTLLTLAIGAAGLSLAASAARWLRMPTTEERA